MEKYSTSHSLTKYPVSNLQLTHPINQITPIKKLYTSSSTDRIHRSKTDRMDRTDRTNRNNVTNDNHHNKIIDKSLFSQFIVIFQAIEIQRLSQEIQSLKRKVYEDQKQIGKFSNFQVQIKELNSHCKVLDHEIIQYRQQLQKMDEICQKLYKENQNLKSKIKIQNSILIKDPLKSSIDKNIEIQTKYQQSQSNLEKEKQKYKHQQIKNKQFQLMVTRLNSQLNNMNKQMKDLEQQIIQKDNEIQKWKNQSISSESTSQKFNILNDSLTNLHSKQSHNSRSNSHNNIHRNSYNSSHNNILPMSNQTKIDKLSQQIYRMSQLILQKNNKIMQLQQQLHNNSSPSQTFHTKNQTLQTKIASLQKQLQKSQKQLSQKQKQNKNMYQKQLKIQYDLQEINKLRLICQNQQQQIIQNLKNTQNLKILNLHYEQIIAKNKQNQPRFSIQTSQSIHKQNHPNTRTQKDQKIKEILKKVKQLQSIIVILKENYYKLLRQARTSVY